MFSSGLIHERREILLKRRNMVCNDIPRGGNRKRDRASRRLRYNRHRKRSISEPVALSKPYKTGQGRGSFFRSIHIETATGRGGWGGGTPPRPSQFRVSTDQSNANYVRQDASLRSERGNAEQNGRLRSERARSGAPRQRGARRKRAGVIGLGQSLALPLPVVSRSVTQGHTDR